MKARKKSFAVEFKLAFYSVLNNNVQTFQRIAELVIRSFFIG